MRAAFWSVLAFVSGLASAQASAFHRIEISLAPDAGAVAPQFYPGEKILIPAREKRALAFYPGEKVLTLVSEKFTPVVAGFGVFLLPKPVPSISDKLLREILRKPIAGKDIPVALASIEPAKSRKPDLRVCGIGGSDEVKSRNEVIAETIDRLIDAKDCADRLKKWVDDPRAKASRGREGAEPNDMIAELTPAEPGGAVATVLWPDDQYVAKLMSANAAKIKLTAPLLPRLEVSKSELPVGLFDMVRAP